MNVHRYIVTGQNRSTAINGILVRDVGRIFRTTNPQPDLSGILCVRRLGFSHVR